MDELSQRCRALEQICREVHCENAELRHVDEKQKRHECYTPHRNVFLNPPNSTDYRNASQPVSYNEFHSATPFVPARLKLTDSPHHYPNTRTKGCDYMQPPSKQSASPHPVISCDMTVIVYFPLADSECACPCQDGQTNTAIKADLEQQGRRALHLEVMTLVLDGF